MADSLAGSRVPWLCRGESEAGVGLTQPSTSTSEHAAQSGGPEPVLGVVSGCVILLARSPPECLPPYPITQGPVPGGPGQTCPLGLPRPTLC